VRTMPRQRPGKSEQVVCTPPEFLAAVERLYGPITEDLACTSENSVASVGYFHDEGADSLAPGNSWLEAVTGRYRRLAWLNPPYSDIRPWVAKCEATAAAALEAGVQYRIAALLPASVGSSWFAEHVHLKCMVHFLSPRLTFVGHKNPYPKDLMLCVYGLCGVGYRTWNWRQS
jgi:hypothetical protein